MNNLKYKVGDKVRIKPKFHFCSVDGFNNIHMKDEFFNEYSRLPYCETVMTIGIVNKDFYILKEDRWAYKWTDEMIEGLVEEETKPKFKVGDKVKWYNHICNITSIDTDENIYIYLIMYDNDREDKIFAKWVPESELTFEDEEETKPKYEDEVTEEYYSTPKYLVRPNGYQFVDENCNVINAMKIVLEKKPKKSKKSPKTDDIIKWLRECDMTKYIGVLYSGICSITFDNEGLIKDFLKSMEDNE